LAITGLFLSGAIASAINAVAGGGSLISYPVLTLGFGIPDKIANATNAVGLVPGSLAGGLGFKNLLPKTGHYFRTLVAPTVVGSVCGAFLLLNTSEVQFKQTVPLLILLAALLLLFQPKVKAMVGHTRKMPVAVGIIMQFLVSLYGGYFGAGMGIMMLACFAFYIDGNIHELNAVKNWLGMVINATCSVVLMVKGLVLAMPALWLCLGSLCGGFVAARLSQKMDPNKLRMLIACYGLVMAGVFAWRALS
jgi:uncharacterized membrane protein YfcA